MRILIVYIKCKLEWRVCGQCQFW